MLSLPRQDVAARGQLLAVFAGFAAVVALAAPGCSEDEPGHGSVRGVALRAVTPDMRARGQARIVGRGQDARLELRVRGLPVADETYEVWLFNSALDTVGLARVARGSFAIRTRLPKDAGRWRYLDVSREPLDGNPNHSGASLLRVPVARLLAAARG
jgi:hypothetical protein